MKHPFKQPTSFEKQLSILTSRGLKINNPTHALSILRHKNYYRLRAYSFFLEQKKDIFFTDTTFEQIEILYNFDRTLRAICMQATGTIEISLRTQFAYQSSHMTNSPIPHEDASLFSGKFKGFDSYGDFKENKIHDLIKSSNESFITHHRINYEGFPIIPVWAMVEVITFATLVKLYRHIKKSIRNAIRNEYRAPSADLLGNWFNLCCVVRNTCAHHSSLWIKSFPNIVMPNQYVENMRANFWQITLMLYTLLSHISEEEAESFKNNIILTIKDTLTKIPQLDICKKMGFPLDWENSLKSYW